MSWTQRNAKPAGWLAVNELKTRAKLLPLSFLIYMVEVAGSIMRWNRSYWA